MNNTNTLYINSSSTAPASFTLDRFWGEPCFLYAKEVGETIEMLYKQTSMCTLTVYPSPPPETRVFKIVYSCVDGKWNKSDPIYGKIIPANNEQYVF